jgi:hypothetical protein
MGWTFYDLASLPEVYDIVWCKWPQREDKNMPEPIVRPVLVRETRVMQIDETKYGAVLISYASGQGIDDVSRSRDLCIEDQKEYRAAGLHKPTRFSLSPGDKKLLPWCEEYFVPPEYVKGAGLTLGKLTTGATRALAGMPEASGSGAVASRDVGRNLFIAPFLHCTVLNASFHRCVGRQYREAGLP